MNPLLNSLMVDFPPPENPYHPVEPTDFSRWNLKHEPPADLVWLYQTYGEGTFHVESGDPIRLKMPTERCVFLLNQYWETMSEIVKGQCLDSDLFTVGRAWFESETRPEAIYWGYSANGLDLLSIWISDEIGWATVIFDDMPGDCICVFRTPAVALHDAVRGASIFSGLFPWAERPFAFIPSSHEENVETPGGLFPSAHSFTPEEIQRMFDESLESLTSIIIPFPGAQPSSDKSE